MKPARVFVKGDKFWLEYYATSTKKVRKSLGLKLDITPPAVLKGTPDWWKQSKHRAKIKEAIDLIANQRLYDQMDLPAEFRPNKKKEPIGLRELLAEYNRINELDREKRLSPFSLSHRRNALDFLFKFKPNASLANLKREDILELRTWSKTLYAQESRRGYFLELRLLFKFALEQKHLTENPFANITVRVDKKDPKRIDLHDQQRVFEWLYRNERNAYFQLMFQRLTFVRISDTCRIEPGKIDLENLRFSYQNNKADREEPWPIAPALMLLLKQLPKESWSKKYLFHYLEKSKPSHILGDANEALEISGVTSHQLKRSGLQEVSRTNPTQRTFDALAHHAPTVNRLAVEHYVGNDLELMREHLTLAQQPWLEFQQKLYLG